MRVHVATRQCGICYEGGGSVRTELFCALAAACGVAAAWAGFGRWGLAAGLTVVMGVLLLLASLAAGRERRGSA